MLSQVGTGAPARITCHHCGLKKPWTGEADWTDLCLQGTSVLETTVQNHS